MKIIHNACEGYYPSCDKVIINIGIKRFNYLHIVETNLLYDDAYWLTHASLERASATRLVAGQSFDNKSFICGYPGNY